MRRVQTLLSLKQSPKGGKSHSQKSHPRQQIFIKKHQKIIQKTQTRLADPSQAKHPAPLCGSARSTSSTYFCWIWAASCRPRFRWFFSFFFRRKENHWVWGKKSQSVSFVVPELPKWWCFRYPFPNNMSFLASRSKRTPGLWDLWKPDPGRKLIKHSDTPNSPAPCDQSFGFHCHEAGSKPQTSRQAHPNKRGVNKGHKEKPR